MTRKYFNQTIAFLIIVAAGLSSCSKSGSNPGPKSNGPSVTITSLSVNTGSYTTQVTITGTGFSSTASSDKILFNGKSADVLSASATQLVTSVPLAAGTGNVTITVNGTTATGPVFTYQKTQVVTSFVTQGAADGNGTAKSSFQPNAVTVDGAGNIYVADNANYIRKITPDGLVSTIAGNGTSGTADGTGTAATFSQPSAIAVDATGNIFVADYDGILIRKITPAGVVTTFAGNKTPTGANGTGTAASFGNITGMVFDGSGNLLVSDQAFGQIRKITPDAVVTTLYSNHNGIYGLALDKTGNLFTANTDGNSIGKISSSGTFSVFAGGNPVANNLDGTGTAAQFNQPTAISIDANNNLYVVDGDRTIRMITPDAVVTTLSGNHGTNSLGPMASVSYPTLTGIAVDSKNNIIYLIGANDIKKIDSE